MNERMRWVGWVAVLAPALYSSERVLWAIGVPVGIASEDLADLGAPGRGSISLLGLAAAAAGTAGFTYLFLLAGRTQAPNWVPWLGGRAVRPRMVVRLLLLPIAILAYANVVNLMVVLGVIEMAEEQDGWHGWLVVAVFGAWGTALPVSTWMYHRSIGRRTGVDRIQDNDGA